MGLRKKAAAFCTGRRAPRAETPKRRTTRIHSTSTESTEAPTEWGNDIVNCNCNAKRNCNDGNFGLCPCLDTEARLSPMRSSINSVGYGRDWAHAEEQSNSGNVVHAVSKLRVVAHAVVMTLRLSVLCGAQGRDCTAPDIDEEEPEVTLLRRSLQPGRTLHDLSDFSKACGDKDFCRRLLKKYEGSSSKSAEKFKAALRWCEQNQDLLKGERHVPMTSDLRVLGCDSASRPVLYQCAVNQLSEATGFIDTDLFVTRMLEAIDMMPRDVLSLTVIFDTHGIKMKSLMNPGPLIQMLQSAECYFVGRLHEIVIVDLPRMGMIMKDAVWSMLQESTRKKVHFLTSNELKARLSETCEADVSCRIASVIDENRGSRRALQERRSSWQQVDKTGALVPVISP